MTSSDRPTPPTPEPRPTRPSPSFSSGPRSEPGAPSSHKPVSSEKPRVFSGIQPSGELHIGNYLGAVRTWARQVAEGLEDPMFCVVDAHAITVPYEPKELSARILALAADLIACGIDPDRSTLFTQ